MGDTAPGQQPGNGTRPPRSARSETRFCRVPQWLYGAGISLQAIAAYGWLHGKYGYLARINPSYATLAEELGVSRGSIINYFKELISVGAVRVTVGGPKGRTINLYEIAFDAPFAFPSGQPADHSIGSVVSPLTTSGQPADQKPGQSGQPVVPDKEVLKKKEDSLSSDAPGPAAPPPDAPAERETDAPPSEKPTAAQRAVRASRAVALEDEQAFIAWATVKFNIGGPGWWKTCAADIPEHAEAWRASRIEMSRPLRTIPVWCGACGDGSGTAARTNVRFRVVEILGERKPCPDCHPDMATTAA